MAPMKPADILMQFDTYLTGRGLRLEGIAIGGAALALLGACPRKRREPR